MCVCVGATEACVRPDLRLLKRARRSSETLLAGARRSRVKQQMFPPGLQLKGGIASHGHFHCNCSPAPTGW